MHPGRCGSCSPQLLGALLSPRLPYREIPTSPSPKTGPSRVCSMCTRCGLACTTSGARKPSVWGCSPRGVRIPSRAGGCYSIRGRSEAQATHDHQQGTRPAQVRPTEWWSVCGGRPGQCVEEHGTRASGTWKRSEAGWGRLEDGGVWAAKTVKRPPQQTSTTPRRQLTRKRHQQEHRPQQPTESSDPTQHAKGRAGDCSGPRKETSIRRNVKSGGG